MKSLIRAICKATGSCDAVLNTAEIPVSTPPIPQVRKWGVPYSYMIDYYEHLGIEPMIESNDYVLNKFVYTTDDDGWAKVLPYLVLESSLYKPDKFMCWGYALKAMVLCHELFGLTTFLMALQHESIMDMERIAGHAYDIFSVWDGRKFESKPMIFEPNDGYEWGGNAFELGLNKYNPSEVFMVGRK